jgi:outer membrane protein assembly factor BamD
MSELTARRDRRRPMSAVLLIAGLLGASVLSLAGCAGHRSDRDDEDNANYVERPVEQIYDDAFQKLQMKRYTEAAKGFELVEQQHPYSIWARRAELMAAFSYYEANKYDDADDALDRFISLHPGSEEAPYAYYLKAICYYEQISDVGRDQETTLQALDALQEVVRRFPDTEYARDAQLKVDLTRDHLAGKEMYVGRYYLDHGQYVAAIGRFKNVIETYQTTSHVPEALERLTEAYYALGLDDEAQASAAVLGYNFPDSPWYKDAYALLVERHLTKTNPTPIQQASIRRLAKPSPTVSQAQPPSLVPPAGQQEPSAAPGPAQPAQAPNSQTSTPAPGAGTPPTPQVNVSSQTQPSPNAEPAPQAATVETAEGQPGTRPPIPFLSNQDLRDTWSRRLWRSLFGS